MTLLAVMVALLVIGAALDWRKHRQALADKRFQEWLARGVHPSLRERSTGGS